MRVAFLTFLVLLGYAAFLFLVFSSVVAIFTKRFSRFWRLCFYLCSIALLALMAVLPLTYTPGVFNDEFANNSIMFWPLSTACSVLALVTFKKPQRYFVLLAVILSIVAFICYAFALPRPRPAPTKAAIRLSPGCLLTFHLSG